MAVIVENARETFESLLRVKRSAIQCLSMLKYLKPLIQPWNEKSLIWKNLIWRACFALYFSYTDLLKGWSEIEKCICCSFALWTFLANCFTVLLVNCSIEIVFFPYYFLLCTEALTGLMVAIVEKDASSCKSSHLPVLFAAYSATLSAAGNLTKILNGQPWLLRFFVLKSSLNIGRRF